MKNYFKTYVSNTLASTQNQVCFESDGTRQKGRVQLKAFVPGQFEYSLLFSDTINSTYAGGEFSVANEICGDWTIHSVKIITDLSTEEGIQLTFNKKVERPVKAGESFESDPVIIDVKDDFMVEIEFSGKKMPYFEEAIVPIYRYINGEWVLNKKVPLPAMIGINRNVEKKIGFLGDSITEGIGVDCGSYAHWNAKIAELTGEKYSYWNIGIGFARAADAASNGAWLAKAKEMDVVTICLGVNDIGRGYSATEICCSLETVVRILQDNKVKTILFTVPPFDYQGESLEKWKKVNAYIINELSKITEIYDVVPVWGDKAPNEQRAIYGGHPNAEGCLKLATDFVEKVKL